MAIPRKQYLANALTQSKPWEALGMSRATWYRKGKPKINPLALEKKKVSYRSYPRSYHPGYRFFVVLSHVGRIPASEALADVALILPRPPSNVGTDLPTTIFETGLPAFDVDKSEEAL